MEGRGIPCLIGVILLTWGHSLDSPGPGAPNWGDPSWQPSFASHSPCRCGCLPGLSRSGGSKPLLSPKMGLRWLVPIQHFGSVLIKQSNTHTLRGCSGLLPLPLPLHLSLSLTHTHTLPCQTYEEEEEEGSICIPSLIMIL